MPQADADRVASANTATVRVRASNLALPVLAAACLLLPGLGALDLWAPDEPRYGQIAEELRSFEHGAQGLWLLHLNDVPYTQKPPLYFWLAALAGAAHGRVSELAARLPSALAAITLVALTAAFGRRLFPFGGSGEAWRWHSGTWAALVLLTAIRFSHLGRRVQLDVLLALLEASALFAYWIIQSRRRQSAPDRRLLALLHGAIALAVLTKGPVALLPYGVIAVHLAWEGRMRDMRELFPAWGVLFAVVPGLVWLAGAVLLAPVGFFDSAVVSNLAPRLLGGGDHDRPVYYYLYQFPADFLPWSPLLVPALWIGFERTRTVESFETGQDDSPASWRFLLSWLCVFVVFFSLMSGKRGSYLLPAYPAAALLCGAVLALRPALLARWLECAWGAIALVLLCASAAWLVAPVGPAADIVTPTTAAIGLALAGLGLSVGAWLKLRRAPPERRLAWILVFVIALESALFLRLLPPLDQHKSARPIATLASAHSSTHERVGVFRHGALAGGVAYYSGRSVVTLETAGELARFVEAGGRLVVARSRDMGALSEIVPTRLLGHTREDERRIEIAEIGTAATR